MLLRLSLISAVFLASCLTARPGQAPAPVTDAPRPVLPVSAAPEQTAATAQEAAQAAPKVLPLADSIALALQARDSVLDAAMLDRLATATPPESPEGASGAELEPAALRSMFDIDVVNWLDHGRVRYYLDLFTGPVRERMAIWLERMPRYEPTIRAQLIAHGLPGDLAYLPLIESGYSPTAVSRSRAVGMWQFMSGTGRLYGLRVDSWVDERRDVVKATDAAIRFLADLTTKFGSPYLAAAAYNGGPGRIERGLARIDLGDLDVPDDSSDAGPDNGVQAGDAAFFQLADTRYIKRETKDYVPKLIAAALIAKQPERYGFSFTPSPVQRLDSVMVEDATSLDVIAKLTGQSFADLWADNPAYLRAVTPPKRVSVVRVPAGAGMGTQLALNAMRPEDRLGSFVHHARRGETLTRIASHYGLSLAELSAANPDYRKRAPRTGELVVIPGRARLGGWVSESRRVSLASAEGGSHKVQRGETLSHLALRYHVSVAQLRAWNHLGPRSVLRVGRLLRVGSAGSSSPATTAAARPRTHLVRAGETLSGLARRYGVTLQALRDANGIPAGRPLLAGQRITIPS